MINVILAFMIIISFLISLILHEFGHSLVATWLGDPTPRSEGRLSLSLRMHLDPLGTLLCVILAFFTVPAGPVGLGWGKPPTNTSAETTVCDHLGTCAAGAPWIQSVSPPCSR